MTQNLLLLNALLFCAIIPPATCNTSLEEKLVADCWENIMPTSGYVTLLHFSKYCPESCDVSGYFQVTVTAGEGTMSTVKQDTEDLEHSTSFNG